MRTTIVPFHGLALSLAITACVVAGGGADFTPLGDLPGGAFYSQAFDVSDDGSVVVGWSRANDQLSGEFRAFRWTESTGMVAIGHIGSSTSNGIAAAVSADGTVIVGDTNLPFRWTEPTGMVAMGTGDCIPRGLSADGSIAVGLCFTPEGTVAATWTEAGGWVSQGAAGREIIDAFLSDVSADGTVAAGQSMIVLPDVEPIRWTAAGGIVPLGDVPGGAHYGLGMGISADGSTIVGEAIGDVGWDAFRWTAALGLQNLELDGAGVTTSMARSVTADGSVVVGSADNGLGAMIWDETGGMRGIQQILEDDHGLDLTGWTLLGAEAIAPGGRAIVGWGWNPDGDIEAWRVRLLAAGDVDRDGAVDVVDLLAVLAGWGRCPAPCPPTCAADTDDDCTVSVTDLLQVLADWG